MAVSCHVVVGASVKDGEMELRTLCMKLAGYLVSARQVAEDVMHGQACLSFVLVSVCSLFSALSSLPSWFGLSLFVKTRAIATLWSTDQKSEFLILRFSHILCFAPYNGGFRTKA